MEIEFYGAVSGVTGSCHVLEVGHHRFLLDCGLIQGSREEEARNAEPFPFDPRVLLWVAPAVAWAPAAVRQGSSTSSRCVRSQSEMSSSSAFRLVSICTFVPVKQVN